MALIEVPPDGFTELVVVLHSHNHLPAQLSIDQLFGQQRIKQDGPGHCPPKQ